jgi:hypothetical protein
VTLDLGQVGRRRPRRLNGHGGRSPDGSGGRLGGARVRCRHRLATDEALLGTRWAEESFVDREVYQERLLAAVVGLVEAIAAKQPTVLCVQDLHWADPSTLGLLRRLPPLVSAPVLIIVNYRPGILLGTGEERMVVGDLTDDQVSTMLRDMLDGTPTDSLANVVAARTGGNPFFVEELAHHLHEAGSVIVVDNERFVAIRSMADDGGIPMTIHGVIAGRLDRLDEHRRRVLMDAAVVGREFLYRAVREVTGDPELDRALGGLVAADLVREKAPEPDLEYLFKHALSQEVAYARLVQPERRRLHGRVAAALEHLSPTDSTSSRKFWRTTTERPPMCSVRFHTSCGPVSEPWTATRRARQQLEALATNLPAQGLGGFARRSNRSSGAWTECMGRRLSSDGA